MDTIKQYWNRWLWRDALTRIITINFSVWLVISAVAFFAHDTLGIYAFLALPSSLIGLGSRIWTLLTYMFVQIDFMHLLCNMLWLMLFGQIFMRYQGGMRMAVLYVYGGIAGAAAFVLLNLIITPSYTTMIGSSCAVMAIVGATSRLFPKWEVNLLVFGAVRLLWLAIAAVVFFVVLSDGIDQAVAHGVGFLTGFAYALAKEKGIDMTKPVTSVINDISGKKVVMATPTTKPNGQLSSKEMHELDLLLAKVGNSGYASLTASERQRLFNLTRKRS